MYKKISLIIGIVVFVLITGATFSITNLSSSSESNKDNNSNEVEEEIGEIVYNGEFPMPVENFIQVTSKFGLREGHGVVSSNHTGIDLCGSLGSRVMAVKDGEVTHAGWQNGYGNCVEIKHTDEQGNTFYTFYAHMRDNSLQVTKGQQVKTGQIIGTQGSTGNSTGDHLHFEVRTDGGSNKYAIDPAPYLFTEKGVD
jgi:murein DD-endopeptidase MepM/ murein hydrolase activator NlpD